MSSKEMGNERVWLVSCFYVDHRHRRKGIALFTGQVGDGKIFVMDAKDAMRIRTGEKGVLAV